MKKIIKSDFKYSLIYRGFYWILIWIIAIILFVSGTWKLFLGSESSIPHFFLTFSLPYGLLANIILSILEILIAILLISKKYRLFAARCLILLAISYTAVAFIIQYSEIELECGCFPFSTSKFGILKTMESLFLLITSFNLMLVFKDDRRSQSKLRSLFFISTFYLALLIVNIFGSDRSDSNLNAVKSAKPFAIFPRIEFTIVQSKTDQWMDPYTGKNIVAVFSPTDCGSCLEILRTLNRTYISKTATKPIIGIISSPYPQAIKKFQEEYKLEFPILFDKHSAIKKKFAPGTKPALFQIHDGYVENYGIVGDPQDLDKIGQIMSTMVTNELN